MANDPQSREGATPLLSRRSVLQLGAAGALAAGGGVVGFRLLGQNTPAGGATPVGPGSAAVLDTERARASTGRVVRRQLRAAPTTVDLGGRTARTWAYDGSVPGPEIRVSAGDELRVALSNDLPDPTTVHWHGLAIRNDMDGVPDLTMDPVAASSSFDYAFVVPDPGTYWFHSHVGVQLDTGMSAPLIVEDPDEPGEYDDEVVLVLDDWTDGVGDSPDAILARMRQEGMSDEMGGMGSGGMGGMGGGGMGDMGDLGSTRKPLGSDTGDVVYPLHLINGRAPEDPAVLTFRPGRRIRLRIINAGSDTAYRFAVGGHRLLVTHTDGFPVQPVEVDTLILGMGERYDVVVTVRDGVFPVVAMPEGKDDPAGFAVLRSGAGRTPAPGVRPAELRGRLLTYDDLAATEESALSPRKPDRVLDLTLQMGDGGRQWLINGKAHPDFEPLEIEAGERIRLRMANKSMMFHPMHVHGHTFAVVNGSRPGIRKDTVNVLPMQQLEVDLQADNPGQWLTHCHNAYHAELGMMTVLSYVT